MLLALCKRCKRGANHNARYDALIDSPKVADAKENDIGDCKLIFRSLEVNERCSISSCPLTLLVVKWHCGSHIVAPKLRNKGRFGVQDSLWRMELDT